jgi:hypothetical protein
MFIETASKRGDRINTTEIVRLWKDKDGVTVAELRDGKRERLGFGNPVNIVALAACEMLPAQPGFEHLEQILIRHDHNRLRRRNSGILVR